MAVISKTKIKSKNKQYYYRFKVDFGFLKFFYIRYLLIIN